jgi:hypothetical protein
VTLSPGFNKKLARAFPRQQPRVRWSDVRERWQLEEKISFRRVVNPDNYPRSAVDSFIRFRDGYVMVDEFEPHDLPTLDKLIMGLRRGSIENLMAETGAVNAGQLADAYDRRDAERAEKIRQQRNQNWIDQAGPIHESFGRQRIVTSGRGR